MNIKNLITELLIITAIISAILVIISKNPVVSVIYLIALFLNAALFLIVKGMPFIGISYILVYLGAIIVLFLFVIMMININLTDILEIGSYYTKNIPLALIVSGLFLYEFLNLIPSYLNYAVFSSFEQGLNHSFLYSFFTDSIMFVNNLFLYLSSGLTNYAPFSFILPNSDSYGATEQTLLELGNNLSVNTLYNLITNLYNQIYPIISYNN
jgi:NADH-ubiquinone oxidoreductase chain 6